MDQRSRIVAGDRDLQRLVLEALDGVQRRLRPPDPAAGDLWDTSKGRPKGEEDISDWLKRQLQDELAHRVVMIDREAQISRLPGRGVGERVDLLVQGIARHTLPDAETVATVIEVKGCWNPGLRREMAEQLADRYLTPDGRRSGIYLIVWFGTTGWTDAGDRRKAACRTAPDKLAEEYSDQARTLSRAHGLQIRSDRSWSMPASRSHAAPRKSPAASRVRQPRRVMIRPPKR